MSVATSQEKSSIHSDNSTVESEYLQTTALSEAVVGPFISDLTEEEGSKDNLFKQTTQYRSEYLFLAQSLSRVEEFFQKQNSILMPIDVNQQLISVEQIQASMPDDELFLILIRIFFKTDNPAEIRAEFSISLRQIVTQGIINLIKRRHDVLKLTTSILKSQDPKKNLRDLIFEPLGLHVELADPVYFRVEPEVLCVFISESDMVQSFNVFDGFIFSNNMAIPENFDKKIMFIVYDEHGDFDQLTLDHELSHIWFHSFIEPFHLSSQKITNPYQHVQALFDFDKVHVPQPKLTRYLQEEVPQSLDQIQETARVQLRDEFIASWSSEEHPYFPIVSQVWMSGLAAVMETPYIPVSVSKKVLIELAQRVHDLRVSHLQTLVLVEYFEKMGVAKNEIYWILCITPPDKIWFTVLLLMDLVKSKNPRATFPKQRPKFYLAQLVAADREAVSQVLQDNQELSFFDYPERFTHIMDADLPNYLRYLKQPSLSELSPTQIRILFESSIYILLDWISTDQIQQHTDALNTLEATVDTIISDQARNEVVRHAEFAKSFIVLITQMFML